MGSRITLPFTPPEIRAAANDTHRATQKLIQKHLTIFVGNAGIVAPEHKEQFDIECKTLLHAVFEGVDLVESLIRARLAEVRVVGKVD